MTVGREHRCGFSKGRLEKKLGFTLALKRKHPDVRIGGRVNLCMERNLLLATASRRVIPQDKPIIRDEHG